MFSGPIHTSSDILRERIYTAVCRYECDDDGQDSRTGCHISDMIWEGRRGWVEMAYIGESLATAHLLTLVRFLARMSANMDGKSTSLYKAFVAAGR